MKQYQDASPIATFSIVGRDAANGDLGVAVQSRHLAVGAIVPWAKAGVGAIAIQAVAITAYGPEGLRLMAAGWTAQDTLNYLLNMETDITERQIGIVDVNGQSAAFTGENCNDWAGHIVGDNYACQGNTLVGRETVQAMADTFQSSQGTLAERLVAALAAGQDAGGDRRGQQSAAILVVRVAGGYRGRSDRFIDLRVDDHTEPITELAHLLDLHKLYRYKPTQDTLNEADETVIRELQVILAKLGHYTGPITGRYDENTKDALSVAFGDK